MAFTMMRNTFKDEQLRVFVEDLAAWIPFTLGEAEDQETNVNADQDDFFDSLMDGVRLCRLVERVSPASSWGAGSDGPEPDVKVKFNASAKPGSFQARDNVNNFLEGCKRLGLREVQLFTVEDMFSRRSDLRVASVLMDLARVGAANGVVPPTLVQAEREIDEGDEDEDEDGDEDGDEAEGDSDDEEEDEEKDELIGAQFKMEQDEVDAVARVFREQTRGDVLSVTQASLLEALKADEAFAALVEAREALRAKVAAAEKQAAADSAPLAVDEWLCWFRDTATLAESAPESGGSSRARTKSFARKHNVRFDHLPYVPKEGDEIDEALADILNGQNIDVRVRRIYVPPKKKSKKRPSSQQGCYRVGVGSQPKVFIRMVRGLLLVRVGNKWEGVVRYFQQKLAEQYQ